MAEYIDRQKVIDMLKNAALISDEDGEYSGYCTEDVDIESIPAADVAPVVHAEWVQVICHVEFEDGFVDRVYECCSFCHMPNGKNRRIIAPTAAQRWTVTDMNDKNYIATYDTQEQIDKCLSCKKPDCTNCMEYQVNMKDPCLDCRSKDICKSGSCRIKTSYRMAMEL